MASRTGSRSVRPAGDDTNVAAPAPLRLTPPVAANDNRAPLLRRLLKPVLAVLALIGLSVGAYLLAS